MENHQQHPFLPFWCCYSWIASVYNMYNISKGHWDNRSAKAVGNQAKSVSGQTEGITTVSLYDNLVVHCKLILGIEDISICLKPAQRVNTGNVFLIHCEHLWTVLVDYPYKYKDTLKILKDDSKWIQNCWHGLNTQPTTGSIQGLNTWGLIIRLSKFITWGLNTQHLIGWFQRVYILSTPKLAKKWMLQIWPCTSSCDLGVATKPTYPTV